MKNKNAKKSLIISSLAAIAVLFILGTLETTGRIHLLKSSAPPASLNGPTKEQKQKADQAAADAKQQVIKGEKNDSSPSAITSGSAQQNSITLSAQQESNNTVTVYTKLVEFTSGSCQLVVTNGSKSSAQKADVIYQSEFSTCAGFSIPIEPIGTGTWNIKLTVTSGGNTQSSNIPFEVR